jgi:hypothetical protein
VGRQQEQAKYRTSVPIADAGVFYKRGDARFSLSIVPGDVIFPQ